jgi:predicted PhzF superfamily epimerase YddE/YHI9
VFEANPAAVCPLENRLDDYLLQKIAEKKLSETAFFFTPTTAFSFDGLRLSMK